MSKFFNILKLSCVSLTLSASVLVSALIAYGYRRDMCCRSTPNASFSLQLNQSYSHHLSLDKLIGLHLSAIRYGEIQGRPPTPNRQPVNEPARHSIFSLEVTQERPLSTNVAKTYQLTFATYAHAF